MDEDKQFRQRVSKISRDVLKEFLGGPEGKELVRSIVIDQQPKRTVKPKTAASKKPAQAERAVKK